MLRSGNYLLQISVTIDHDFNKEEICFLFLLKQSAQQLLSPPIHLSSLNLFQKLSDHINLKFVKNVKLLIFNGIVVESVVFVYKL